MLPLPRGAVWQIFFLLCAVLLANEVRSEERVVCYYTNWSVYRPGTAKFNPQNINPYLCTHLIYAFGGFTKDNTMKPFDKYQDIEQGGYAKFTGLKTYNKQLKTMIAIGGWNEASSRFSPLVANAERRQKFIKNILKFLRQNHFDGLDLDWEYPAHRDGGKSRDKDNYAQFVQELRSEFDRESAKTGRPRLLLTMAVPAGIQYIEKGYDIPKLNKYLDWFNMLTYDFHSSHEPSANHHAPLYSLEAEDEYNFDSDLNIDYSVKYYLDAGADRDKLVLGIPTYGRSYTLFNEESTDLGAPADGPGEQGDATREKGYLAYYEICQNIKEDPDWNVVQPNAKAMGPYAFKGNQWVGYDDEAIVRKKAEYVVENGLGGIMFWAIDNDDFRGTCTGKPYPLIEAAKETYLDRLGLGDNEVSKPSSKKKPLRSRNRIASSNRNKVEEVVEKAVSVSRKRPATRKRPSTEKVTTTSTSTFSSLYVGGRTTTPQPPTTPDPGSDFKCEDEGFFQHPRDCKKYFWCLDSGPSNLGIVAHQFTCPSGLYFNPAADSCDFARNVPCNKNPKEAPSTTVKPTTTTTTTARTTTASSRITAATSRNSFARFTSTTEAPEEEDDEYEDEIQDPEEDPRVIKELIDLIKKVGGIEELEKHLLQQEDGSVMLKKDESSSVGGTTTPSTISKSLYKKVLSRPNNLNAFRNKFTSSSLFRSTSKSKAAEEESEETVEENNTSTKYSSVVRNSRPGPQNAGIDKLPEFDGFLKEKKKYVTIQRNKPLLVSSVEVTEDEEDDDAKNIQKDAVDEDDDEEEIVVSTSRRPTSSSTPAYTSIRRTKPTIVKPAKLDDDESDEDIVVEKKAYTSASRNRVRSTTDTVPVEDEITTAAGSRYKFIERTRPTRRPTTTEPSKEDNDEETDESKDPLVTVQYSETNEITTQLPTQQQSPTTSRAYASIGRRITTTTTTSTTKTDQDPIETTTPESFVIDTTTPEPIIITTTTTTTNPTSIETSTQSFTTTPILALSASTLSSSTSQNDDEDATIASKIPNTLATESGLDTQELDTTKNQILTETTTIDENYRNEVTNLSLKTTTSSNKSQSSLNNLSSSSNSVRGNLKNNFSGGSRRQQQKQKTTTTTTIDTNQQQHETSTNTNEFLGTVSSPRPFGFPRRRTRPTTTTTTNVVDDADASSTVPTSETATPLAKKVSSTEESYLRSRSRLSQNVERAQTVNSGTSFVVDHVANVVGSLVGGNSVAYAAEGDVKKRTYSWKDTRNPIYRPPKLTEKQEQDKLAIAQYYDWQVAQDGRRDDERYKHDGDWQKVWGQSYNPSLSYSGHSRYGAGTGVGLNGFENSFAGKWDSGQYRHDDSGKWRAKSLKVSAEGEGVYRRGYGTGGRDVLSAYQYEDSIDGQYADRGWRGNGGEKSTFEESSGGGNGSDESRGDGRYTEHQSKSGAYEGWDGHYVQGVSEGQDAYIRYRGQQALSEGSGDETEANRLRSHQSFEGQSLTAGEDGKYRVKVNHGNSIFTGQSQEGSKLITDLQRGSEVSERESEESRRRKTPEIIGESGDENETSHRRRVQQDKWNSTKQSHIEGSAVHRTRIQQGSVVSEGESEESHRRKAAEIIGGSVDENEISHLRRVQQDKSNSTEQSHTEGSAVHRTILQQVSVVSEGESEESHRRKTTEVIEGSDNDSETSHRRRVQQDKSNSTEQSHTEGSAVHRTRLQQGSVVSEGESEESHRRNTAEIIGGYGDESETSHGRRVQQDKSNSTEQSNTEGSAVHRTLLQQVSVVSEGELEESHRRKTTEVIEGSDNDSETSHRRRVQQDKSNSTEDSHVKGSSRNRTGLQQGTVVSEGESEDSHRRKTTEVIEGSSDESETSLRRRVQQDKSNSTEDSYVKGSARNRTGLQQGTVVSVGESEESHRRKTAEIIGGSGHESETSHRRRAQQDKSNSTELSHTEGSAVYRTRLQQGTVVSEGESEESHRRKTTEVIEGSDDESEAKQRRRVQQEKSNSTKQYHTEGSAGHRTRLQKGSVVSEGDLEESHRRKTTEVIEGSGDESETSHGRRVQQDKSNSTEQSHTEGSAVHRTLLQQGSVVSEGESEESHRRKTAEIIGGSGDESETSHGRRFQQDKSNSTEQSHTEGSSVHRTRLQQGTVVSEGESEESHRRKTTEVIEGSDDESEASQRRRVQQEKSNSTKQSHTDGSAGHRARIQQGSVISEGESEESHRRKATEVIEGSGGESETSHGRRVQQVKSNSTEQSHTEGSAVHRILLQQGSVVSEGESEESHRRKTAEIIGGSGDESENSHGRRVQQDKSNSTEQSLTEGSAVHRTRLQQGSVVSEGESEESHRRKTSEIIGGSGDESETSHGRRVQQDQSNSTEDVVSEGELEDSHRRKTTEVIEGSGDESETSHRRRVQQDKSNSTKEVKESAINRTGLQQGSSTYSSSENTSNTGLANDSNLKMSLEATTSSKTIGLAQSGLGATATLSAQDLTSVSQIKGTNQGSVIDATISSQATGSSNLSKSQSETEMSTIKIDGTGHETDLKSSSNSTMVDATTTLTGSAQDLTQSKKTKLESGLNKSTSSIDSTTPLTGSVLETNVEAGSDEAQNGIAAQVHADSSSTLSGSNIIRTSKAKVEDESVYKTKNLSVPRGFSKTSEELTSDITSSVASDRGNSLSRTLQVKAGTHTEGDTADRGDVLYKTIKSLEAVDEVKNTATLARGNASYKDSGVWNGHSIQVTDEDEDVSKAGRRTNKTTLQAYNIRTHHEGAIQGSGDETETRQRLRGQSHTETNDGRYRVRVKNVKSNIEGESQENVSRRVRVQQHTKVLEEESLSEGKNTLAHRGGTRYKVRLQNGSFAFEDELQEALQRRHRIRLGDTEDVDKKLSTTEGGSQRIHLQSDVSGGSKKSIAKKTQLESEVETHTTNGKQRSSLHQASTVAEGANEESIRSSDRNRSQVHGTKEQLSGVAKNSGHLPLSASVSEEISDLDSTTASGISTETVSGSSQGINLTQESDISAQTDISLAQAQEKVSEAPSGATASTKTSEVTTLSGSAEDIRLESGSQTNTSSEGTTTATSDSAREQAGLSLSPSSDATKSSEAATEAAEDLKLKSSLGGTTLAENATAALSTTTQEQIPNLPEGSSTTGGLSKFGANEEISSGSQTGSSATTDRGKLLHLQTETESHTAGHSTVTADRGHILHGTIIVTGGEDKVKSSVTSDRGNALYKTTSAGDDGTYRASHQISSGTYVNGVSNKGDHSTSKTIEDHESIAIHSSSYYGSRADDSSNGEISTTDQASHKTASESVQDGSENNSEVKTESDISSGGASNSTRYRGFKTTQITDTIVTEPDSDPISSSKVKNQGLSEDRTRTRLESVNLATSNPAVINRTNIHDSASISGSKVNNQVEGHAITQFEGQSTGGSLKFGTATRGHIRNQFKAKQTQSNEDSIDSDSVTITDSGLEESIDKDLAPITTTSRPTAAFTSRTRFAGSARKSFTKTIESEESKTKTITNSDKEVKSRDPTAVRSRSRLSESARRIQNQVVTRPRTRVFTTRTQTETASSNDSEGVQKVVSQSETKKIVAGTEEEDEDEYYYETATSTTRRPRVINRGNFRPKFNDLSSLLAIDFHRKQKPPPTEGPRVAVRRRRPVQRVTTESTAEEEIERSTRPTRPPRTTTTTVAPKSTVRPTSSLRRIESGYSSNGKYALRRKLNGNRVQNDSETSSGVSSTSTSTTNTEEQAGASTLISGSDVKTDEINSTVSGTSGTQDKYTVRRKLIRKRIKSGSTNGSEELVSDGSGLRKDSQYTVRRKIIQKTIQGNSGISTDETVSEGESLKKEELALKDTILNLLNGTHLTNQTNTAMISETEVKVDFETSSGKVKTDASSSDSTRKQIFRNRFASNSVRTQSKGTTGSDEATTQLPLTDGSVDNFTTVSEGTRKQTFRNRVSSTSFQTRTKGSSGIKELTSETTETETPNIPRGKSRLSQSDLSSLLSSDVNSKSRRRLNFTTTDQTQGGTRRKTEGNTKTTTTTVQKTSYLTSPVTQRAFNLRKPVASFSGLTEETPTVIDSTETVLTETSGDGGTKNSKKTVVTTRVIEETSGVIDKTPTITEEIIETQETGIPQARGFSSSSTKTTHLTSSSLSNELLSEDNPTVPIYTRRKYYKYLTDSPITYLGKFGGTVGDNSKVEIEETTSSNKEHISKAILDVFDIYNHSRSAAAAKIKENESEDGGTTVNPQDSPPNEDMKSIAQEINNQLNHFLVPAPRATTEVLGADESSTIEDHTQATEDDKDDEIYRLALDVNSMGIGGLEMAVDESGEKISTETEDTTITQTSDADHKTEEEATVIPSLDDLESLTTVSPSIESDAQSTETTTAIHRNAKTFKVYSADSSKPSSLQHTEHDESLEVTIDEDEAFPSTTSPDAEIGHELVKTSESGSFTDLEMLNQRRRQQIATEPSVETTTQGFTRRTTDESTTTTELVEDDEVTTSSTTAGLLGSTRRTFTGLKRFTTAGTTESTKYKDKDNELTADIDEEESSDLITSTVGSSDTATTRGSFEARNRLQTRVKPEEDDYSTSRIFNRVRTTSTAVPDDDGTTTSRSFTALNRPRTLRIRRPDAVKQIQEAEEVTEIDLNEIKTDVGENEISTSGATTRRTFNGFNRTSPTAILTTKTSEVPTGDEEQESTTRRSFGGFNRLRTTTATATEKSEGVHETDKEKAEDLQTKSEEITSRGTFSGLSRLRTTTEEDSENTEEATSTVSTPTRRTFTRLKGLRTITTEAAETIEADKSIEKENEEASTTRRIFPGFNRLRTTTTEVPEASQAAEEIDTQNVETSTPLTTRRTFAGFNRLRTTSAAPEASEAPEEEEADIELEGVDASTVATTGSTRRAFVGFNRLRTTTTETPKEEDASTTRRALTGFNKLRTTTAEAEEATEADSASTVRITDTTRPPFAGLNRLRTTTTEASDAVVEEDSSTVPTIDTTTQPLTSVDLTTSLMPTEESDSSTEVNEDEDLTADIDEEGVTEEVPPSSTIQPTVVNLETTTATPIEVVELSIKPEEGDEGEFADNKTTTITPIEATTASIAPEAESTTFVKANRITTTTSPTETSETPETDTTLEYTSTVRSIATTRRTFARLNRLSTTTSAPTKPSPSEAPKEENEVDVKSEDTGAPATTRRTFGGLNRLRTTTTEAVIQPETDEIKSSIASTTRRTLINYNRFRTTTASAIPIEEDNQPIETEDEEENTVDVTSRRSFVGRNSIRSTTTEGPTTRRSFAPRLRTTSATPSIDDSEEDDDNEVTPKSGLVINRLTNAQQQTQTNRTRLQLASRQNLFNRNQGFRAQSGNTQANKDEAEDDDEESDISGEEEEIVPRPSTTTRSYPALLNRNQFKIQGSTQSVSNEEHNEGEEEETLDEGEEGEVTNTGNIISLLNRNRFRPKQGPVVAEGEEPENEEKPTLSLLQLRNRVKTEQSQSDKDEGVINSRLQQILATADEESTAQNVVTSRNRFITTRAPVATSQDNDGDKSKLSLLQLRDKVKTEQSQSDRDTGVINTRLQKNRSEGGEDDDLKDQDQSKNSLLQLRNRVKIAQFQPQDNGVINSRLQKILSNTATEDEDSTSQSNANQRSNTGFRPTQAPQSYEDNETTKPSLLQLRDRVKTAQFQSEDTGVLSTRLQKLLANRKPSSPTTKLNNLTNQTTTNFTVGTIVERTHTNNLSLTQSNDEDERTELGQDEDSEDSIVETNSNLSTNTPNLNRRFQRVQFNRTAGFRRPTTTTTSRTTITTSTQVNPSLVDVVDSSSASNLGLTSAESGTSADDETTAVTSTEAALKQRRRLRVLKYRRPLIVNNSLSVESSNSTNTTTSSTESVDNLSVGPELNTTINTSTSPTPTRRFRKVIKKLRPLVNRTATEDGTSGDTERPLNIAEFFSKLNSSTTTVSATESAENATATEGTTSEQTGTEVTSEETVSTTTLVAPTPRRLLVNRRPYVPTKPSLNAITATTEANAIATPKTYVRKFNRNFKAIRPPTDAANGIGYIQRPQPTAQIQSGFQGANRFRFPTRTTPKPRSGDEHEEEDYDEENDVDEEEEEEEGDEEDGEEQEEPERVVVAPVVRQRVLFNRNQVQSSDFKENKDEDEHTEVEAEDEEEDDEEENIEEEEVEEAARLPPVANRPIYTPTKRPSNRPSFNRPSNSPLVPNRQAPAPAPVNRFALDRRPSNKPRVVNRPIQITLPPNLLSSDQPTIPSSITPPSVFISSITRSYERKYSASTENVAQDQSNPLLEDLDIDALNARNKKIFEVNSKKHTTTIKPKIVQNQPQPGSDTTDTTPLDTSTVFQDEDNNLINSQDDSQVKTTTTKVVSNYAERPASEGQLVSYSPKKKIITVSRVVEINSKEAKLSRKSKDEELRTVESTELRSEGLPKLEALGEISRVKHVHLVDGSDIVVDGHSTVTDYTPTEASIFVRNTIPEVEPDSLENTRIDYQAGPTSAPVRNTIPDVDYSSGAVDDPSSASVLRKSKGITVPEVIADVVEASTISLQGLFDSTRQAKKISETANEVRTATIPVRRPVVRRRLFTTAQPAASTSNDELNADGTSTISTINTDDDVVSATSPTTSNFKYNRRTRPSYLTTIAAKLKPTPKALSSSLTSSNPGEITTIVSTTGSAAASSNDITFVTVNKLSNQKFPSGVMRRKLIRPLNANRSTPADSSRSTVPSDEVAITDPPRTQNPLFKRRFPFSTTSRPAVTSTPPTQTEFNTSPFYLDTLIPEDIDQVAKSSIQEAKFFQNQISDNLSEPDHSPEISISTSTFSSTTPLYLSTYEEAITRRLGTAATTRRPSLRRPQKTTPTPEKAAVFVSRRRPHKTPAPFNKIVETQTPGGTYEHAIDYDYYDDGDERVVDRPTASQVKVVLHGKGIIECLDQGNFPHPLSCRKFISCAKFETGGVVGWEYTCPKGLSYDPVGGMCNWAAGLGCKE